MVGKYARIVAKICHQMKPEIGETQKETMEMFKKKYPHLSFAENFLGGHLRFGNVIIYGENAMHWAVNICTKRFGWICFRLPFLCFGRWWPLYFYVSPDATPTKATFIIGNTN